MRFLPMRLISYRSQSHFFSFFFGAEFQRFASPKVRFDSFHPLYFFQSHNRIVPLSCPSVAEAMWQAVQRKAEGCLTMKNIFKVLAQSETFAVQSQKAEGGQLSKCNIVLQELGGKYENSFVATVLGEQAKVRFAKNDVVVAALRFSTREYNGQVYQDIMVGEIIKLN